MRLSLQSLVVLCPFLLNTLYATDSRQSYYLEEEIAEEEEFAIDEPPYYLDEIVEAEDSSESMPPMDDDSPEMSGESEDKCTSPFRVMHAGVRHVEARGIGYQSGYTTVEGFGIYDHNNAFMPFLDLRGHVFDDGKVAGNIGIGERTALFSIDHLLGIYFYYDVRQDRHGLTVNQVSPGIELLGSRMEYRINGYFPVGSTKGHKYGLAFDKFDGNNIILKRKQREALTGGDAEVGVHITQSTKYDLYAGAGSYYFSASHASSWGGKVRLLGRYKQYISLEASYSYDRLFKSVVQGTVSFNLPFGAKLKRRDNNCSEGNNLWFSRGAFAPQRFEIPVVKKITHRSKAINPATNNPWQVFFVNNTSHSAGTYQSPFPTLLQAQNASSPDDMIYVFPGDGTTNGMNQGITLQDGQQLFGSGIAHTIRTKQGKIKIPSFSSSAPTITSGTGNVVSVGNGNEISGMAIQIAAVDAIGIANAAAVPVVNGININNNAIGNSAGASGIELIASGNVNVFNNAVGSTIAAVAEGIGVFKGGPLQATISNNAVAGYATGIQVSGETLLFAADYLISGNAVSSTGAGGRGILCVSEPVGSVIVANNTIIGGSASGNALQVTSVLNSVIESNQINYSGRSSGILISALVAPPSPSVNSIITLNNLLISNVGGFGINLQDSLGQGICASINGNQVTGSPSVAFLIVEVSSGQINIESFANNIGGPISTEGTVNLVPQGTCNQ